MRRHSFCCRCLAVLNCGAVVLRIICNVIYMSVKCIALTEEVGYQLVEDGYCFLSVFSVYEDEDLAFGKKLLLLKPFRSRPASYLIKVESNEINKLLSNSDYRYCIIHTGDENAS